MIRIIEGPKMLYRKRCPNNDCNALLQFSSDDLVTDEVMKGRFIIQCPCCKYKMIIFALELEDLRLKGEKGHIL